MRRFLSALLLFVAGAVGAQQPVNPKIAALFPARPTRRLTDLTGVISNPDVADSLINKAASSAHMELAVVILPTIGDFPANEVAMNIGRAWHVGNGGEIGDVERGHGAVILIVPKTASVRGQCFIAPAAHSSGYITDSRAGDICQDMIQEFKRGDYAAGMLTGVAKVSLAGERDYAERHTPKAPPAPSKPWPWGWILSILAIVVTGATILIRREIARQRALEAEWRRKRAIQDRAAAAIRAREDAERRKREEEARLAEAARWNALTPAQQAEEIRQREYEAEIRRKRQVEEEEERRRRRSSDSSSSSWSSYDSGGSSSGGSDWGGGGGGSYDGGGGGSSW